MKCIPKTLNLLYFSATGNTKDIVKAIGQTIEADEIKEYNLANEEHDIYQTDITQNSLTIIGVPVYRGRVPIFIAEKLKRIKSNGSLAIVVCVYGNRHFDDTLLELNDIAVESGFKVIAASAFIGEHSYSTDTAPIAHNRPDKQDFDQCDNFAQKINTKLKNNSTFFTLERSTIPGNYPYKDHPYIPAISPETIVEDCILCGICSDICPTNAIAVNKEVITIKEKCIWCYACIKKCPTQARIFKNETIVNFVSFLTTNCKERKEPEWVI